MTDKLMECAKKLMGEMSAVPAENADPASPDYGNRYACVDVTPYLQASMSGYADRNGEYCYELLLIQRNSNCDEMLLGSVPTFLSLEKTPEMLERVLSESYGILSCVCREMTDLMYNSPKETECSGCVYFYPEFLDSSNFFYCGRYGSTDGSGCDRKEE